MKNLLISFILFTMLSATLPAQSIYFRAGTGYGLPIATVSIGEMHSRSDLVTNSGTTYNNSVKSVKASYGSGLDFNFAFGYRLNQNFIIDLNFQYLVGRKYETGSTYGYIAGNNGSYADNDVTTASAKGLLINPSVIFSAGFGKAAPYARFGLIGGAPTVTSTSEIYYNGDGVDSIITRGEYTKGLAFGFQSAVGMNWKISEKIDLFTEVNFVGLTYYPGEYNLTKSIRGTGNSKVDQIFNSLTNMTVSQKSTVFEKKYDPSVVNSDATKPRTALRESFPFSSLSLKVGIRFDLWKKAE
jgi:hypothetical protein